MNLRSIAAWSHLCLTSVVTCLFAAACSSSSSNPAGSDSDAAQAAEAGPTGSSSGSSSSSTSSGSGSASGGSSSSSGSPSSSGGGSSSGVADAGSSSGAPIDASIDGPTMIACGMTSSCNLQMSTCCIGQDPSGNATGQCIMHGQPCPALTAAFSCGGASDCPAGQVCCGQADQTAGMAQTACASTCPTKSSSPSQGQAQVCRGSAECQNNKACIAQVCQGKLNLDLCGLTSQPPFSCKAR